MENNENKERDEKIVQLFNGGWSVNKIAAKYEMSMYRICQILGPAKIAVLEPPMPYSRREKDDGMYLSGIKDAYIEHHMDNMNFNY